MTEVPTSAPTVPFVRLTVLTYEAGDLLHHCVASLLALDWPADRREVVVIDNASTDGSVERLEAAAPGGVRVLRNPRGNTGFSANNLAFADLAGVDHVGLVNPDSTVDPGWLHPLVTTLEGDATLGAACPRILLDERFAEVPVADGPDLVVTGARVADSAVTFHVAGGEPLPGGAGRPTLWVAPNGSAIRVAVPPGSSAVELELAAAHPHERVLGGAAVDVGPVPVWCAVPVDPSRVEVLQSAGSYRHPDGNAGDIGWLTRNDVTWDRPADVAGWCGASVLLRARYLAEVGGFDESFFLYYEDTDLSWRGERAGWRYRYVPEAVARHHQSATIGVASPLGLHHQWRNRLRMVRTNAGRGRAAAVRVRMSVSLARSAWRSVTSRPPALRRAHRAVVAARVLPMRSTPHR